jgi:hypothetical protein
MFYSKARLTSANKKIRTRKKKREEIARTKQEQKERSQWAAPGLPRYPQVMPLAEQLTKKSRTSKRKPRISTP